VAEPRAPHRLEQAATSDRRLLARSSVTLISRSFSKFAQILFLVLAARLLSVEEFASYSYLLVLAAAFTILSDTGVPLVASRDASAGRASPGDLFFSALPVVVVSAALAALVLPVVGAIDSGPGSTFVPVLVTTAYVFFNRMFDFTATMLRGVGRFTFEAVLQSAGAVFFIVGASIAVVADLGVTAVLAVLAAKELVSGLIAYAAIRRDLEQPAHTPRRSDWRGLLKIGIRLAIAGVAVALLMRVPLAVLGNVGTAHEVALFSAAQRFGDAVYILAISSGFALMPGISYLAHADPQRARRLLYRVILTLVGASGLLAAAALPFAEPIMRAIFGGDFASGANLLRIVLIGVPGYATLGVCWFAVVAFDGEARLVGIGLVGLAISAVLSAILIPSAGGEGAAWTYVGSLYAMAALTVFVLERQLGRSAERPAHAEAEAAASALG
jgi:O-antigen/teichoic acid export membrane protein